MERTRIRNMEEFSAVSGVSRPTLSKYFQDADSVRSSTRARIEAALKQFDYRPNIYAMNQNRKLTRNVGIVVPFLADPFFAEIARTIEERCIEAGYRPTLFSSHGLAAHELEIFDALRSLKPAGVLFAPMGRSTDRSAMEKFCAEFPTVLFDSPLPELELTFVGSDNPQLARVIIDYLCRSGEPPCFMEMKTPANPNANRRRNAYLRAMEVLGHTPHVVQIDGEGWSFEEIGRREGVRALRANRFRTNTILCSNDRLAIGLLSACYEVGHVVGLSDKATIRVAGQDDHPFSRFTCPPLTTVSQDYNAISVQAVEALVELIEGEKKSVETIVFEGRLLMRDSA